MTVAVQALPLSKPAVPVDRRASKPVCGGDWVTATSGVYGFVDGFAREHRVRVAIVLEFDPEDDHADSVEHRIPLSQCVPVQGVVRLV
ncbi:MAG: hypothetical protein ACRD0K_08445 [Egibacteraceae bacterium]